MRPVVLTVGGSDSSGGAGIQADVAVLTRLDVHPATVVTAVTAQHTGKVVHVHVVPPSVIEAQLAAVFEDLPVAAVKTGLLATPDAVHAVGRAVANRALPVVVDPVLVATSGDRLAGPEVAATLAAILLPHATVITPNLDEAAALVGRPIETIGDMERAGRALVEMGAKAALVKGGHLAGRAIDMLVADGRAWELDLPRTPGGAVHGTGCALSAVLAAALAIGTPVLEAACRAKAWVAAAIEQAEGLGAGARILGAPVRFPPVEVRKRC